MRVHALILLPAMLACEGVQIHTIPPEPDAGVMVQDAYTSDGSVDVSIHDAGPSADAGCDPATHVPAACRSGDCYGAVLCIVGDLHCIAPVCDRPPDPDECDGPDYVFIHDRSESMRSVMGAVQAQTSSLAAHRDRNLYFFELPRFSGAQEAGPASGCYHPSQPYPLPPCLFPGAAIDLLPQAFWGAYEPSLDALWALPDTVAWTPGRSRHVFLFADEKPQGVKTPREVIAVLVPARIKVHVYTNLNLPADELAGYESIALATGGSIQGFGGPVYDPCP